MVKNAPYIGEAVVKRGIAKLGKRHTPGMCQREIRLLFGVPSAGDFDRDGDADAHDAWKAASARGQVVRNRNVNQAPRGAYLYFSGGKHGHVALGLGGDDCVSTDAAGRGVWGRSKISNLEKRWNRQYEGYIVITWSNHRVFSTTPPVTTPKTRYEVTANRLNARSGPGTGYAIKTTRDKGFRFNSRKRQGDWVQASKYWYHKNYLKVVKEPTPKPIRYEVTASRLNARSGPGLGFPVKTVRSKGFQFNSKVQQGDWAQASTYWYHKDYLRDVTNNPPESNYVNIRIGSLNIPLDSDKLPDGPARAKEAAKQIKASNLAVLGTQELDRSPGSTSHNYATMLLKELGKGWEMIRPTTAWNENYLFLRTDVATLNHSMPDTILTSPAGGRHATRALITKDGSSIKVISTHLVSGAGNGPAREIQGDQLAEIADSQTIIVGDLNQKALPKALTTSHKTARDSAAATTNAEWGTFSSWKNKVASKAATAFLDHIAPPKHAIVRGYTVVGIGPKGVLDQPRISDHLLIIASIDL